MFTSCAVLCVNCSENYSKTMDTSWKAKSFRHPYMLVMLHTVCPCIYITACILPSLMVSNTVHCGFSISVSPSDKVLHTVREKEKNYTDDQNDPEVVQPYAAFSPAGHAKVKSFRSTHQTLNSAAADPQCRSLQMKVEKLNRV